MSSQRTKIMVGAAVAVAGIWGLSVALANSMVPDRNPPERYNGPIANAKLDAVLQRACFDCHSHETKWPWYTNLPVVSVLIAHDVGEGREKLNFSLWGAMSAEKRAKALHESGEEVSEGEMPMAIYLPLHPEAKLTDAEKAMFAALAENKPSTVEPGTEGQ